MIKPPKLPTQGSCSQQHFSRGNFVSVLINSTEGTKPEYRWWQLIPLVWKVFLPPSLYIGAHAVKWKLVQNFKENQRDTSHCSSFLDFHGLCRAPIHHLAHVILVIVSDFCFLFCSFVGLRWCSLQWSYWRIWLLQAAPPPCSPWSCRCRSKRWWRCTDMLCAWMKRICLLVFCNPSPRGNPLRNNQIWHVNEHFMSLFYTGLNQSG